MDAVRVEDFSFAYPGCQSTLEHVDWTVRAGAFVLLTGATGSGKSTLLRCLKPELAPVGTRTGMAQAVVRAAEGHVPATGDAGAIGAVGFVMQDPSNQIICDTVWHEMAFGMENVGTSPSVMRRRIAEIAHFFGMESWMHAQTDTLSGGQQQMLNVAAALALRPQLLLLDEPTSQLDPVAEKNFLHMLFRVNRELGITVVVATHAPLTMADYATDIVRLEGGRIAPGDMPETRAQHVSPSGFEAPSDAAECVLDLDDVYFRYARDASWVLRGADMRVRQGSVHAVVGGNGCGKSTMLQAMAGIIHAERGRVNNRCTGRQVLLPQSPKALFVCDTVEDELCEWQDRCGYTRDDVEGIAQMCGLSAIMDRHPYDLSGGQQQMAALAKILLPQPQLLLLDEPTKGLDTRMKCAVADMICRLREEGRTVVMSTHDLAFAARVSDTTSMLFDGQVVCTEPTADFFKANLFYVAWSDDFTQTWPGKAERPADPRPAPVACASANGSAL